MGAGGHRRAHSRTRGGRRGRGRPGRARPGRAKCAYRRCLPGLCGSRRSDVVTPSRSAGRLIAAGWLLFVACLSARADEAHHIFWEVKGKHNTVYLLGSVHMLKAADSALPAEAMHAYEQSQVLVMELDLNGAGAESLLESGAELETLREGHTLAEAVGAQLHAK